MTNFNISQNIGAVVREYSTVSALEAAQPAVSNDGLYANVLTSSPSGESGVYRSDGTVWVAVALNNTSSSKKVVSILDNLPERELYVDHRNGDDTNDGSLEFPLKNVHIAVDQLQTLYGDNAYKSIYIIADGFTGLEQSIFLNTKNWRFKAIRFDVNASSYEASVMSLFLNRRPALGALLPVSTDKGCVVITNLTKAAWDQYSDDLDGAVGVAPTVLDINPVAGTWVYSGPNLDNYAKVAPSSISANTGTYLMNITFEGITFIELSENIEELGCPIYSIFGRDVGSFDYIAGKSIKFIGCSMSASNISAGSLEYAGLFYNCSGVVFTDLNTSDNNLFMHNCNELTFDGSRGRGPQDTPVWIYLSDDTIQTGGTLPPEANDARGRTFGLHGSSDTLLFRDLHLYGEEVMLGQYVDELRTYNQGILNSYGVVNLSADPRGGAFENIHRSRKVSARSIRHSGVGRMNTYQVQAFDFDKLSSGNTIINVVDIEGDMLLSSGLVNIIRGGTIGGNLTIEAEATFDLSGLTIKGNLIVNGITTNGVFDDCFVSGDIIINSSVTGNITYNGGGYMGGLLDETLTPAIPIGWTRNIAN